MSLIEVENVSKRFRRGRGVNMIFGRGGLGDLMRGQKQDHFDALHDISFTVERGESLGIIGRNGSGKSTLLKILAGVTAPTTGVVRIEGRVASLLELGAGFHNLLTGRENVYLNAQLLGMSKRDVNRVFDEIIEFSGVGEFIDNPVETFSSGMYVRLGFAVAVHTDPDVFLVDEVLSVGDEDFQRKCRTRIGELKEQGKTIVFVSHDLGIVNAMCDRVILLIHGEMTVRNSPQDTIDYYLRQVGQEVGIHTLRSEGIEVVSSHGRVSLYRDQQEVSAASGYQAHVESMGHWHPSTDATWEVVESDDTHCVMKGSMPRLPLTHLWELKIEKGRIIWKVGIEASRTLSLAAIEVNLFMPLLYHRWVYGDRSGAFPEILPNDHDWGTVYPPDLMCREAAALPGDDGSASATIVEMDSDKDYMRLQWVNTDYVTGCRVLQAGARIPPDDPILKPGRHALMTLALDLTSDPDRISAVGETIRSLHTVHAGPMTARFVSGQVELAVDGHVLTKAVHLYTSMLMSNLWTDSPNLQWTSIARHGAGIVATGEARRFPFSQRWRIRPDGQRLRITIELEARDLIEVQECHMSLGIVAEYTQWRTEHESGAFPPIEESHDDWRHANRDYAVGTWAEAEGDGLPKIRLVAADDGPQCRPTAVNTGFRQHARVLQALRAGESGPIRFETGRHVYFDGYVEILTETDGKI